MASEYEIVVVGGGLAGLSAAYHAAVRGAQTAFVEGTGMYGGLIANVSAIDALPGGQGTPGVAFADTIFHEGQSHGVDFVADQITSLDLTGSGVTLVGKQGSYSAQRIILASGGDLRRLGIPGEVELENRGVSRCAWCDGGLFKGKRVAVVGGGDSGLQAALHLVDTVSGIDLIVRGAGLRARRSYVSAAADNPKIAFHWETNVISIEGTETVTGITVRSDSGTSSLPCAGVFLYAGLIPNTGFLPAEVIKDERGAVIVDADGRTSVPTVFAVGAARAGYQGQGVNALSGKYVRDKAEKSRYCSLGDRRNRLGRRADRGDARDD